MTKIILYPTLLIILFLNTANILAQNNNFSRKELADKILNQQSKTELSDNFKNIFSKDSTEVRSKEKSPYLAALMSGIIPGSGEYYAKSYLTGSGEYYAKSYLKSAIFLGVELGLWTLFGIYQNKGNVKTDEYQDYANSNWNINKYAAWLKNQGFPGSSGINPNEPNFEILRSQVNICEEQNFSHTLPPFGEQQYYEVIGKYQNFISGWSTAGVDITKNNYGNYVLLQVQDYMYNRETANDYYSVATYSIDVIVLNHLLSAADAAWTVTMFNKNLNVKTSFNVKNLYNFTHNQYKVTPFANIRVTF
jgi:hypothetical protein